MYKSRLIVFRAKLVFKLDCSKFKLIMPDKNKENKILSYTFFFLYKPTIQNAKQCISNDLMKKIDNEEDMCKRREYHILRMTINEAAERNDCTFTVKPVDININQG